MAHRVVIIGGGFAGLTAARNLDDPRIELTLVDRRNFHLFQPLLYQVATGGLSPGEITAPLRHVLSHQKYTRVLLGEVLNIEPDRRSITLQDGSQLSYDTLVVASGSTHHYFGHEEWSAFAPGLKSIEDATEIRTRILLAFERAEHMPPGPERESELSFVVVGGGPTGVELAGTLADISRDTLRKDFRNIDPKEAKIFLVEGAPRLLPAMPEDLSASARRSLESLGVTVLTSSMVTNVGAEGVSLAAKRIPARTVLWAAGVQASPLGRLLANRTGVSIDSAGRIQVSPDLSIPGHPEILITGDLAHIMQNGKLVPGVAPAAMQQGSYAARSVLARVQGKQPAPFHYKDKGNLATIGRNHAVAELGKLHFSGYLAWLLWLFIHLLYIVGFENRLLIAIQWGFEYFTWNRGARLITGPSSLQGHPECRPPEGSGTAPHNPDRSQLQTRPGS
jgi:NADH dehydrogenase